MPGVWAKAAFSKQAVLLMKDMARRYPTHPLAYEARKYAKVFDDENHGIFAY